METHIPFYSIQPKFYLDLNGWTMNNFDSFDSNRRVHAICHVWKMIEWERSGDSICTKCSRETFILLLYGKILWIHSLFFSNTTVEMCSCVITQWVLYTNRPDSIGSLYSFEWNCIASTHSYSHWNIYLYIYYLVNGWFWKALVCCSKFINFHNNLSCMSWNSNNKLSKRKIFVGAFKEVLHINIVHE